jgi:hypothetical protein
MFQMLICHSAYPVCCPYKYRATRLQSRSPCVGTKVNRKEREIEGEEGNNLKETTNKP